MFRCWHLALGFFPEFQERAPLLLLVLLSEWAMNLELLRPSDPQRERLPEKERQHRETQGPGIGLRLPGIV